jgi:hypothetical protein
MVYPMGQAAIRWRFQNGRRAAFQISIVQISKIAISAARMMNSPGAN